MTECVDIACFRFRNLCSHWQKSRLLIFRQLLFNFDIVCEPLSLLLLYPSRYRLRKRFCLGSSRMSFVFPCLSTHRVDHGDERVLNFHIACLGEGDLPLFLSFLFRISWPHTDSFGRIFMTSSCIIFRFVF